LDLRSRPSSHTFQTVGREQQRGMAESDRNMRRIFLTIGIMAMAAGLPAGAAHCLTPAQSAAAAAKARSDATARARLDAEAKARADALAAARPQPDAAQLQK